MASGASAPLFTQSRGRPRGASLRITSSLSTLATPLILISPLSFLRIYTRTNYAVRSCCICSAKLFCLGPVAVRIGFCFCILISAVFMPARTAVAAIFSARIRGCWKGRILYRGCVINRSDEHVSPPMLESFKTHIGEGYKASMLACAAEFLVVQTINGMHFLRKCQKVSCFYTS